MMKQRLSDLDTVRKVSQILKVVAESNPVIKIKQNEQNEQNMKDRP